MDYYLHSQGRNLGVFSLEELRRRRLTGQLTGAEYVWRQGMVNWQKLDQVLQEQRSELPTSIPPLPPSPVPAGKSRSRVPAWVVLVAVVAVLVVGLFSWGMNRAIKAWQLQALSRLPVRSSRARPFNDQTGLSAARKPVVIGSNTVTAEMMQDRDREFQTRQWLENYEKFGSHDGPGDADARLLIRIWLARTYCGPDATNNADVRLDLLADKVARDCTDPLVLTVAAMNCGEQFETSRRLDAALKLYGDKKYPPYPEIYAALLRGESTGVRGQSPVSLNAHVFDGMQRGFKEGSLRPEDQAELAELFINGRGYNFFYQNGGLIAEMTRTAGPKYEWLQLVLRGEVEIAEAWRARGGGYSGTVTEAGWDGFRKHLEVARDQLTRAWKLHPDLPVAPCRMIYVALGSSDIAEMRLWFDRTLAAQVDYPRAWSDFRWGLRPRWYGSHAALLALGITAANTRRYDTDVPRMLFDCVSDIESELELPPGHHIYGRNDVWPYLQRMYEGYIAQGTDKSLQASWRSSYATIAYLAGKYDVARDQLEAVNWEPTNSLSGWGRDLSLMPLEVAARTGLTGRLVDAAETSFRGGDFALAAQRFAELSTNSLADVRTRAFADARLGQMQLEQRLQPDAWVDFLPAGTNDPLWVVSRGQYEPQADGSVEVRSDKNGHMLYCRARVGMNFEARGEFEVVSSSSTAFQAGLVMGLPDFSRNSWYAYRIKRNDNEGDVVSLSSHWHEARKTTRSVILNARTNSFFFRLQGGRAYGSVNGQEIFFGVDAPYGEVSPAEFMLGLGAFNDQNDTVLRYRQVQVRKLAEQKPKMIPNPNVR